MMQSERDYFYNRAEAEIRMAQQATAPEAVRAHYQLAGLYLDRVYRSDGADGADGNAGPVDGEEVSIMSFPYGEA